MDTNTTQQLEIDLFALLRKLWTKKYYITWLASLVGLLALVYGLFLVTPLYQSTTRIYVVNQNAGTNTITTQELAAGDYLVKDYREIILSKDVMMAVKEVAQTAGLTSAELENLDKQVTVGSPDNTRVISIGVTNPDPEKASYLANEVRKEAVEKIKEVTKVEEVTTLEAAEPSNKPASPNVKRYFLLGVLVGGFLAVVSVVVKEILDDRVKRPEDIEEVLGMTLLGMVPEESQLR